jgi:hypothetical protein
MRYVLLITILSLLFVACKKDSGGSAPQISYVSLSSNTASQAVVNQGPILTIHVKDADGDLGFIQGSDTSFVFVKNLLSGILDSIPFPDIDGNTGKNFSSDVLVSLSPILGDSLGTSGARIDTLYFQVYVKDFAQHVSDTIVTPEPVYYYIQQ